MKDRQEIETDVEKLFNNLKTCDFFDAEKRKAMVENIKILQKYAEQNDLWDDYCWGSEETVVYTAMFVTLEVNFKTADIIKNPEAFYNYVDNWFQERADHYRGRADRGYLNPDKIGETMCKDCAAELVDILKQGDNND